MTKNSPHFRTDDQATSGADLLFWNCSVRKFKMSKARCIEWSIGKIVALWKNLWRKFVGLPTAVCSLPSSRLRRRLFGLKAVRDEREIFVTRSWRWFCKMISSHMLLPQFLDDNRPCFRYGGQTGCGSEMSCVRHLAVRSLVVFRSLPACSIDEWSHLWSEWPIGSAGIPLPLLWEYVRCPIGMTVLFTAHHSSVCLSVLYAEPHFHIESTPPTLISIW